MDDNNEQAEAVSPAIRPTPVSHSGKPNDPALGPASTHKSDGRFADESDREIDVIPRSSTLPTQSPLYFLLGNFFFAMSLISLILSAIFFAVAWFTVVRDARSMNDRMLSNATGVSLCSCHNKWALANGRRRDRCRFSATAFN